MIHLCTCSITGTPVQHWDHYISDGYKRKSSSGTSTPLKAHWDGIKTSQVVTELENLKTYGYGAKGEN